MAEIVLKNIRKTFGPSVVAVDDLNLTIQSGSFVSLLGPSGCGKTTTLRMIAGLDTPDGGELYLDGKLLFSESEGCMVPTEKRGMGLVFQSYALWPHMTVAQNVSFGLEMRGMPKEARRKRVQEVLELLHIDTLQNRYPSELSGGQQQRVALARMLAINPDVLLLDEPLSNLDAKLRLEMRTELKRLHQTLKNTILYVTHDQLEAMTLSTHVAVMHNGRILQYAPPLTIYRFPADLTVAAFVGSPPMNFFSRSENEGSDVFRSFLPLFPGLAERVHTVGVRPEDLYLSPTPPLDPWSYPAIFETVLPTGSDWIVSLRVHKRTIFLVLREEPRIKPGEQVWISTRTEKLHLFDTQQKRIESP